MVRVWSGLCTHLAGRRHALHTIHVFNLLRHLVKRQSAVGGVRLASLDTGDTGPGHKRRTLVSLFSNSGRSTVKVQPVFRPAEYTLIFPPCWSTMPFHGRIGNDGWGWVDPGGPTHEI